MKTNKRFSIKTLLAAVSAIMVSFCLMLTVACTDGSQDTSASSTGSDSSAAASTVTDYQVVTNGDFEFGTTDKEASAYPVSSSVSWTRSNDSLLNSATSSNATSGIIDTADETYKATAKAVADKYSVQRYRFPVESGEGDNTVYYNPSTPQALGYIGAGDLYTYSEETENENKLPTSGTKILMIHNVTSEDGRGTAQKFTSTKNFTVSSYGMLSVWVMTKDLKTAMDTQEYGAYVQLRTTIGSETNPVIVKNINTNGDWVKVTFYLNANQLADTSFKVVLGLGFGSKDVRQEYVEGFAYFDNVYYKDLNKSEYETAVQGVDAANTFTYYAANADGRNEQVEKKDLVKSLNYDATARNYSYSVNTRIVDTPFDIRVLPDREKTVNDNYAHAAEVDNYGGDVVAEIDTFAEVAALADGKLDEVESPAGNDAISILIYHPTNASSSFAFNNNNLPNDMIVSISFYAKVSTELNITGLSVNYHDDGSSSDKPSTLVSAFTTKDVDDENTNGFVKVTLFVTNTVGDGQDRSFDLIFTLGTTDSVTDYNMLTKGYAVMTGFTAAFLTQEEFDKVSSSTYTGIANLGADLPNGTEGEDEKDSYSFTYAATNETTIKSSAASNVNGYTGVVGKHVMTDSNSDVVAFTQEGTTAGIINTKYIGNYAFLTQTETDKIGALEKENDNDNLQPLLIKNYKDDGSKLSYGYLSSAKTVSAGTTTLVSVKVKVIGNEAVAYVYLVDADNLSGFPVLTISAKDYAFDNETSKLTVSENDKFNKAFVQTVTEADCNDGWATVYFAVTAGENDISYRIELWNGSRDEADKSTGTVLFDSVSTSTVSSLTNLMAKLGAPEATETVTYTRVPTLVNYVDDDGKDATRYETYGESTVYTEYADAKAVVASFAAIDVTSERTEVSEDDTSASDEETSSSGISYNGETNLALYITSIVIAIVLVLVLVVVGVRMMLKKTRKSTVVSEEFYSRDSREKAQRQINANKARREAAAKAKAEEQATESPAEAEEQLPAYDYENMENNIPAEETETPSEEAEAPATEEAEAPATEAPAEDGEKTE